ncbi:uncharacterized protein J3R85_016361 [Psidium guajava]|nr:uncharacterized protein J3R85_016361 [Psidium guajava]
MLTKRRTRSICTVHGDRLLALAPTNSAAPSESRTNRNPPQNGGVKEVSCPESESTRSNHSLTDSTGAFRSNALKISAKCRLLREGKRVHARVVKSGLCSFLSLQNLVLDVYVKRGQYRDARTSFDEIPMEKVVTWNTLIRDAAARGTDTELFTDSVICFMRMLDGVGESRLHDVQKVIWREAETKSTLLITVYKMSLKLISHYVGKHGVKP